MLVEKNNRIFKKQCQDYLVLHNLAHNAIFMFHKDVELVWDTIGISIEFNELLIKLSQLGYDISSKELDEFICFLAELGAVRYNRIEENENTIFENNQYENYIDYCCSNNLPSILHIELTNSCNLKCIHCFHDEKCERLSFCDLKKVFREIRDTSFVRVTLTGGEIGLHPQWRDILECAQQNGMSVAILSNLTCFNDEDLDYLAQKKLLFVRTSLYGASQNTHETVTGIKNSFLKTMHGIDYLKSKNVDIRVACSVMKCNYSDVFRLKKMMETRNVPIEFGVKVFPSRRDKKDVSKMMIESAQYRELIENGLITKSEESSCNPGSYRIAIDQNGNIYSCDALRIPIGKINNDSIFEALNSTAMKTILEKVKTYHPKECISCKLQNKCFRCPGIVWSTDLYANKHHYAHCMYTKMMY